MQNGHKIYYSIFQASPSGPKQPGLISCFRIDIIPLQYIGQNLVHLLRRKIYPVLSHLKKTSLNCHFHHCASLYVTCLFPLHFRENNYLSSNEPQKMKKELSTQWLTQQILRWKRNWHPTFGIEKSILNTKNSENSRNTCVSSDST